jgi:hypothetical protein
MGSWQYLVLVVRAPTGNFRNIRIPACLGLTDSRLKRDGGHGMRPKNGAKETWTHGSDAVQSPDAGGRTEPAGKTTIILSTFTVASEQCSRIVWAFRRITHNRPRTT